MPSITPSAPGAAATMPDMQQALQMAQQLMQQMQQPPGSQPPQAGAAGAPAPPLAQRQSVPAAAQMLATARVQRRLTPRSACRTYDTIIQRWPDSLEADEARLMIEDILRRDSRLKEQREREGKYTGG